MPKLKARDYHVVKVIDKLFNASTWSRPALSTSAPLRHITVPPNPG
jgi:hypothetical protein